MIPTVIGSSNGLSSEFIYNCNTIDINELTKGRYRHIKREFFPHIKSIIETCGQPLFEDNDQTELNGIPREYSQPPIQITSNEFNLDITEFKDKFYSIMSFHSPLNITLLSTAPLGWVLNSKSINDQYLNLTCLLNRVPIMIVDKGGKERGIFCFSQLMSSYDKIVNKYFTIIDDTEVRKTFKTLDGIKLLYGLKQRQDDVIYKEDGTRAWNDNELENQKYGAMYSEGRWNGMISPQPNDWYESNNNNQNSSFSNTSFIKCLIQIAMLGNIFSTDLPYYTLTNAIVILTDEGKYTGKYWTSPKKVNNDNNKDYTPKTKELVNRIMKRISENEGLQKSIIEELNIAKLTLTAIDKEIYYEVKDERNNTENSLISQIYFSINLFTCTLGLEEFLKQEFALFIAGILGHSWDKLLRFFNFNEDANKIENEFLYIKTKNQNWDFVKHYGTPIASYLFDFKGGTDINLLGGYNSVNFSHVINENLISIRERITQKTIYNPPNIPNCLIPIVFSNAIIQCKTKCFRSFRSLLGLMKTRKQREYLFDHITQFGRRAMTVLDPYGIFMYYHNDQKGLVPA